jgi:hypothetical protein
MTHFVEDVQGFCDVTLWHRGQDWDKHLVDSRQYNGSN